MQTAIYIQHAMSSTMNKANGMNRKRKIGFMTANSETPNAVTENNTNENENDVDEQRKIRIRLTRKVIPKIDKISDKTNEQEQEKENKS